MPGPDAELSQVPPTFGLPDWPKNTWYAAAYDIELKHELFARTVAGRHLVMYRKLDGTPVALENACWHRLLPLSEGTLEDDDVVCTCNAVTAGALKSALLRNLDALTGMDGRALVESRYARFRAFGDFTG